MDPIDKKIEKKSDDIEKILNEWGFGPCSLGAGDIKKSDIKRWFHNFEPGEFEDAFLILSNIQYHGNHKLRIYIEGLSKELRKIFKDDLPSVKFFPLGQSASSSGAIFLYDFRKELALPETAFPYCSVKDVDLSGVKAIVFFDDIIGSGNQALKFAEEHLEEIEIDKYYVALLAFEKGFNEVKEKACFEKVIVFSKLSEEYRAFSPESQVFPEHETRQRLQRMCKKYGEDLFPKHPLGYDDSQALIVFPHNTPNNTLPIIWASDKSGRDVVMLLPGKELSLLSGLMEPLWALKSKDTPRSVILL